ncbi:MAG: helix-turn-helix domain-containing protein [Planctomycetota bacterium]
MPEVAWLTSAQVRKRLKISTCDLAHLRQGGKLRSRKQGNAYLYRPDDVDEFSQATGTNIGGKCSIAEQDR